MPSETVDWRRGAFLCPAAESGRAARKVDDCAERSPNYMRPGAFVRVIPVGRCYVPAVEQAMALPGPWEKFCVSVCVPALALSIELPEARVAQLALLGRGVAGSPRAALRAPPHASGGRGLGQARHERRGWRRVHRGPGAPLHCHRRPVSVGGVARAGGRAIACCVGGSVARSVGRSDGGVVDRVAGQSDGQVPVLDCQSICRSACQAGTSSSGISLDPRRPKARVSPDCTKKQRCPESEVDRKSGRIRIGVAITVI